MALLGRTLDGARLRLRDLEPSDATDAYERWMNDPEVTRYLESRFGRHDRDSLRGYIETNRQADGVYAFAIELVDGDRHIGNIKLGSFEEPHRRADIGILIGERDCWGRGYATEAIALLTEWAFADLGLEKLTAAAYGPNTGSIRAFERAGFTVEAVRPRHYRAGDEFVDGVYLARLRA